jgi:hypothetical protein
MGDSYKYNEQAAADSWRGVGRQVGVSAGTNSRTS